MAQARPRVVQGGQVDVPVSDDSSGILKIPSPNS
jgi:hypothetical protein